MADERDGSVGNARGQEKLAGMVSEVMDLFLRRLAERAREAGGRLQANDLQDLAAAFKAADDPVLEGMITRYWNQLQGAFEQTFWAQMRKFPLERLIVSRFASLLADRGAAPIQGKTLSRRIIPAFTGALHQMIGPELFDEYENRARGLVESHQAQMGKNFDWEVVQGDQSAQLLVNDLLIYIARYFTDVAKRREWMKGFFERTMPASKDERERAWVFGDVEFHILTSALYAELATAVADDNARDNLRERYGDANVAALEQMLAGLAQDRKRVY